ncbi:substrate-binding domain-containing protein [Nesterenkonia halotolerans]|uniref:DNA-binding LacI/PurR family transcriptional regulator n=1 Tax=Nesterenkonia halotolerans TaxID=225325 RepID=A0ABR9JA08_9MICC|nr:substrate-binding domain-containing protein [Nesterenkonia halotolerans]MBE1515712.1 DNA-binding LacI/PurR family transcriptional regulator [Nesterenkonia halotolerans]
MRESIEERRLRILDVLDQHEEVKVAHLAALLNVSMVTVRRDLETMATQGSIQRRHGMVRRAHGEFSGAPEGSASQGTVAIIAPERHSYLGAVTHGARRFLEHAGFRVVLHLTPNTANPERHAVAEMLHSGADGVLLAPRWRTLEQQDHAVAMLADLSLPTVLLERRPSRALGLRSVDSVCTDHVYGVHLALDHLTSKGHVRILLAAREDSPTARTVNSAFVALAREHPGIEHWMTVLSAPDAGATTHPSVSGSAAPVTTKHRARPHHEDPNWLPDLVREQKFTAVIIHSDENALVLSQRLEAAGVRVPQDCAVVAYDDVVAGLGNIPLTAVSPPKEEVGRAGALLLSQRIRAERGGTIWTPHRVELLPDLRVRDST